MMTKFPHGRPLDRAFQGLPIEWPLYFLKGDMFFGILDVDVILGRVES